MKNKPISITLAFGATSNKLLDFCDVLSIAYHAPNVETYPEIGTKQIKKIRFNKPFDLYS